MKISKQSLPKFIKYALASGFFGLLSFVGLYMIYHLVTPQAELFLRFFDSNTLSNWLRYNVFDIEALMINIMFWSLSLIGATGGLISAMLAQSFHKKALQVLEPEFNA